MKIFMLGWELPPFHTGGLGVVCYQMCKQLASSGADIDFVLPYDAPFNIDFMNVVPATDFKFDEMIIAGGAYGSHRYEVHLADGTKEVLDMRHQQDLFVASVLNMSRLAEFDVIHAHDWLTFRAAMALKAQTGKPLIAHVHATEYDRSGGNYGNPTVRDIEYAALMMADIVFAVSENTRQVLINHYHIPADKVQVVHNSMDIKLEDIHESDNAYRQVMAMKERGYKVVTNAGRLTLQKGLTHFLEAAQKVVELEPKTLFLVAGGGDQYHELIEYAADLGILKNVIFTGYLNGTGKQWRDAFKVSDLFVMPSVNEPFGVTPIESIAYGTPALVSRQSGVSEILQNVLKVDFWDIDEMANQIVNVLRNPSLKDDLQRNAYAEFESMSWESSANKMLGHYHSLRAGARA